jgi:F5/8 type C domain
MASTKNPLWPIGLMALALCFTSIGAASEKTAARENLALNKPASASSIENDDQNAAMANDGDDESRWCADDEPDNGAEWWRVDLEKPADLTDCQIIWPYDDKCYRYKIEGSADGKTWKMMSDQTQTSARTQVQDVKLKNAARIRYVKVTITGVDPGCWASIAEVKVFGHE